MATIEQLGKRLAPIYAVSLDLLPGYSNSMFEQPNMIQCVIHYPPRPAFEDNEFSTAPHTDSSCMTFLAPSPVPGLSIRLLDGT